MGRFSVIVAYLLLIFGGGCTLVALPYAADSLSYLSSSSGSEERNLAAAIVMTAGLLWLVGGALPLIIGYLMLRQRRNNRG